MAFASRDRSIKRPSLAMHVAGAILVLVPLVQGCDSLVAENQSSLDGGASCIMKTHVDGGTGTSAAEVDSAQPIAEDAASAVAKIDSGEIAMDATLFVDQIISTATTDTSPAILDSVGRDAVPDLRSDGTAEVSDAHPQDVSRDLDIADSFDASPDVTENDGAPELFDAPIEASGPVVVQKVAVGMYHSCALRSDGRVYCWGEDSDGQSTPPADTFVQIEAGDSFSCGVASDGRIICWGSNNAGQCAVPTGEFTQVATGSTHSCGLQTSRSVTCQGDNEAGESTPPSTSFSQITAGALYTCGLQANGKAKCWGRNSSNQLVVPTGVFLQIHARQHHTCGVLSDQSIACWGSNDYGESSPPTGIFAQVSAGYWHACGVQTDGTVVCWGDNSNGQCTPVSGTFLQVSAGAKHTCGLRTDGSVVCWGDNSAGQSLPP